MVKGGRIDVLVITHEHWDHVSAFPPEARTNAQDDRSEAIANGGKIEPLSLWMAWTEDPKDDARQEDQRPEGLAALGTRLGQAHGRDAGRRPSGPRSDGARPDRARSSSFFGERAELRTPPAFGAARKQSRQSSEAMSWIREVYAKDKTAVIPPPGRRPDRARRRRRTPASTCSARRRTNPDLRYNPEQRRHDLSAGRSTGRGRAACFVAFGVMPPSDGSPPKEDFKTDASG